MIESHNGEATRPEVSVQLPHQLRPRLQGARSVQVQAATVGEAIAALEERFPGITFSLCHETGEIRRFVNVFVGVEDIRYLQGLDTRLESGQTVFIFHSVAGGA